MNYLKYSNENHINIIPQKDFEALTHEVFNVIASNLSKSLGPLGSSATILDGMIIEATKDGYSILSKYMFHNRYKRMIYNLIRQPCTKMNNTVGDGTTTAITLTYNLFARYEQFKGNIDTLYRLPRQLTAAIDSSISKIKERVEAKAKPIQPDDYDTIYNIAYVVSNGNKDISSTVANAYKSDKTPTIKMKDSPTNKSYMEQVSGFEFPTNAIDNCYVRNQDLTATEIAPVIMVFNHCITTDEFKSVIAPLNDVYRDMGKKMIILAPQYDEYFMESTLRQYVNFEIQKYRQINLILTQFRLGKLLPDQLNDFATVMKTRVIVPELSTKIGEEITKIGPEHFIDNIDDETNEFWRATGKCESVLISTKNGSIFNPDQDIFEDENYQKVYQIAKAELKDAESKTLLEHQSLTGKVYDARSRVLQLEMKNYIYYVGADSELQKQILEAAIDDVIKCLRSAVKYGVVPGCQLTVIQACGELMNEYGEYDEIKDTDARLEYAILDLIRLAVLDTYMTVLQGPDKTGILKTIPIWSNVNEDGVDELIKMADQKTVDILNESVNRQQVFDLETLEYNPNIITSAQTDTMVLTAASELIKILISGNQCIFLDSDVNTSHQDDIEAYLGSK